MKNKKIIAFLIFTLVISFILPFILEYLIYRNNFYSVLDNSDWSGFLGSYISGLIGGIGTLVAVYISISETRKVQYKSDKDKDYSERKTFSDDIVVYISRYITDINRYFYNCKAAKKNKEIYYKKKNELNELLRNIELNLEKISTTYNDQDEIIKNSLEREALEKKEAILRNQIKDIEREIDLYRADRAIAIECYYILNIKLKNISHAAALIDQLKYMHTQSYDQDNNWISRETDKLVTLSTVFVDNYCNDAYK